MNLRHLIENLLLIGICACVFWLIYSKIIDSNTTKADLTVSGDTSINDRTYRILWYNPPPFIRIHRPYAMSIGFKNCKYRNCNMSFDKSDATISQAVIFEGRRMPQELSFIRPTGQVWIFSSIEPLLIYGVAGNWWYRNKDYIFNWTMTYNKDNTDIFLPYGELRKVRHEVKRDFKSIAVHKNKTLLFIASNCKANSKRQEYVNELRKYIDVEVLGKCGKAWNCGVLHTHDEKCFQLLNTTYKFNLAFENALCHQYFSQRFYENFNYDLIMLTRGGSPGEAGKYFPKGTFIATEDFKSIKDLAHYLKSLSTDAYSNLLKQKSQYYSPGYSTVYERALCDICERMNFMTRYAKTITNIKDWAFGPRPCLHSNEVSDI